MWTLRNDISDLTPVNQIWSLRHDISSLVNSVWTLRSKINQFVNTIWTLRNDVSHFINRSWEVRNDILNLINQFWNFRHDSTISTQSTVIPKPYRMRKFAKKPIFREPQTYVKTHIIKIQIPTSYDDDFDFELPIYNTKIVKKTIPVYGNYTQTFKIPTSKTESNNVKIPIFIENNTILSLKPDFRIEKLKNLSKLKKLLNTLEK